MNVSCLLAIVAFATLVSSHSLRYPPRTRPAPDPGPDKATTLIVSEGRIAPDGFERDGFLVNGEYPSRPLFWDEQDDVQVTVVNNASVPVSTVPSPTNYFTAQYSTVILNRHG